MTAWVTIADSDIDPDSPITTSLMTALRDNPIAITEKATGAPVLANDYIVNAMIATNAVNADSIIAGGVDVSEIAANAVHQSELNNANATQSQSLTSGNFASLTLTGGNFTLGAVRTQRSNANYDCHAILRADLWSAQGAGPTAAEGYIYNAGAGTQTVYINTTYIAASPPYDLGDGEFDHFLLFCVDTNGDIIGSYSADDPIWFHNGRKKMPITKKVKTQAGIELYTTVKDMDGFELTWQEARRLPATMKAYLEAFGKAEERDILLTPQMKNANMSEMPHPFMRLLEERPGAKVVMIDPFCSWFQDYKQMRNHDEFAIADIIEHINLSANQQANFKAPPNVIALNGGWK